MNLHQVFHLAMSDISAAAKLRNALRSPLVVPDPFLHQIGVFLYDFVKDHRVLPKQGDWELWASDLPEMQRDGVIQALSYVRRQPIDQYTVEFAAEQVVGELRQAATNTVLTRVNEVGLLTPQSLQSFADEINAITVVGLQGVGRLEDVDAWGKPPVQEDLRPTGLKKLDRWLGGGFGEELTLIMADSGVGKTTVLCNLGKSAHQMGSRVLHVSMELSTHNTLQRYYRNIAGADKKAMRQKNTEVVSNVKHWLRYAKGTTTVMFVDAYSLDPEGLRSLCLQYAEQEGGLDVLILDYIDLMAPPPDATRLNEYQQLGRITHLVRNLKDEFGCSILSATQSIRGASATRPRLSDMGDSYNKVRAADNVFALVQTPEEFEAHQARLVALKIRESMGRSDEIRLYVNMDLMSIMDLDHPITQATMAMHNHALVDLTVQEEE